MHGSKHYNYSSFDREQLKDDLGKAIDEIEAIFEERITTWYPPYGRKGENPYGIEVCKELGIKQYIQKGKVDAKLWIKSPKDYPHVNFHFWYPPQIKHVEKILSLLHAEN